VNRGTMGVNSLPKTVTRQRRGSDLNPGPSAPESSTLTTRLPSHPQNCKSQVVISISAELAIKVATAHFSLTSNVTTTVVSSKNAVTRLRYVFVSQT